MEMETNETRDPTLSNVNHQENETEVISALKFEGESNGNVIFFSRKAPLERLLERNRDEVLKAEAGAKVQKFTKWVHKCISIHSHSLGNRNGVGCNSTIES
ncbi:Hypothetical predicted protein [Olea europaea subsp. europaea]|uniref:Uncharacterized protein n=1 Tax=Olea europaea subsp. europaea TaxID=158383 RepID=A0A8S0SB28_OLEEU|nr:Hypothetical predicted protein [Olea europaea subsp. europaea]